LRSAIVGYSTVADSVLCSLFACKQYICFHRPWWRSLISRVSPTVRRAVFSIPVRYPVRHARFGTGARPTAAMSSDSRGPQQRTASDSAVPQRVLPSRPPVALKPAGQLQPKAPAPVPQARSAAITALPPRPTPTVKRQTALTDPAAENRAWLLRCY
jgi:hypothetical protein